jgi:hypothetical protein
MIEASRLVLSLARLQPFPILLSFRYPLRAFCQHSIHKAAAAGAGVRLLFDSDTLATISWVRLVDTPTRAFLYSDLFIAWYWIDALGWRVLAKQANSFVVHTSPAILVVLARPPSSCYRTILQRAQCHCAYAAVSQTPLRSEN